VLVRGTRDQRLLGRGFHAACSLDGNLLCFIYLLDISSPLLEGIAGLDRSPTHTTLKPFHALRRGSMGERIGTDLAAAHALQPIVSYCGGGPKRTLHVASFEQVALFG